jgi:tetratricopeptide (TPR) repeat protein
MLGRTGEAAALIGKTPIDCYSCVRVRGMVAQARGDLPEAQRWFVEAVRQGPRLAPAYADWGKLLIRARRFESAEAKLARAAKLSPNWADPLKYWGDALAARGKRSEAIAKYDAALTLAPTWEELKRDRAKLIARA